MIRILLPLLLVAFIWLVAEGAWLVTGLISRHRLNRDAELIDSWSRRDCAD